MRRVWALVLFALARSTAQRPTDSNEVLRCNGGRTSSQTSGAHTSCACLSDLRRFGVDKTAVVAGRSFDYGPGYGINCATHDAMRPPACHIVAPSSSQTIHVELPTWCFLSWCYVNASQCGIQSTRSSYFPTAAPELHYSYATCNATDLFDPSSLPDLLAPSSANESSTHLVLIPLVLVLSLAIACMVLWSTRRAAALGQQREKLERQYLRYVQTQSLAVARPLEPGWFHLFLSHTWVTGQDRMRLVKTRLSAILPDLKLFLDVDDLTNWDHATDETEEVDGGREPSRPRGTLRIGRAGSPGTAPAMKTPFGSMSGGTGAEHIDRCEAVLCYISDGTMSRGL